MPYVKELIIVNDLFYLEYHVFLMRRKYNKLVIGPKVGPKDPKSSVCPYLDRGAPSFHLWAFTFTAQH